MIVYYQSHCIQDSSSPFLSAEKSAFVLVGKIRLEPHDNASVAQYSYKR